jgi:hypothetical protein
MSELQTTYNETPDALYPGMVISGALSNRISRTVEDSAGIAFGKAAFRGAADHGATATPTAGKLLGISIATKGLGPIAGQTADTYQQYDNMAIMPEGEIAVASSVAVAQGDQAYVTSAGSSPMSPPATSS